MTGGVVMRGCRRGLRAVWCCVSVQCQCYDLYLCNNQRRCVEDGYSAFCGRCDTGFLVAHPCGDETTECHLAHGVMGEARRGGEGIEGEPRAGGDGNVG